MEDKIKNLLTKKNTMENWREKRKKKKKSELKVLEREQKILGGT